MRDTPLATCCVAHEAHIDLLRGQPDPIRPADVLAVATQLILPTVSFALLERVVREACAEYVQTDGTVIKTFTIMRPGGQNNVYTVGKFCSSLRDVMLLLGGPVVVPAQPVAVPQLSGELRTMIAALTATATSTSVDEPYKERNTSQHGQGWTARVAIINNLITARILLQPLKEDFDDLRQACQETLRGTPEASYRSKISTNGPLYPSALEFLLAHGRSVPSWLRPTMPPPTEYVLRRQ